MPPCLLIHRRQRGSDIRHLLSVPLPGQLQREHPRHALQPVHHWQARVAAACSKNSRVCQPLATSAVLMP
jgi:hypothetical protein